MTPDWAGYLLYRDAFTKVMDPRHYTIGWLDTQILSGAAWFVRSAKAGAAFEFRTYPTGFREVHGLIAAGDLGEIVGEIIPAVEEWAKSQGCGGAVIESRPGWVKALKGRGYQVMQVAVRKDL